MCGNRKLRYSNPAGSLPGRKFEFSHAGRSYAVLHRSFLCLGVSLCQGVRKVEVAHAHGLDLGNRTDALDSSHGVSHRRAAFPGEILICP